MFDPTDLDPFGGADSTYVLVPVDDQPGEFYALFSDGSYGQWTPREASA